MINLPTCFTLLRIFLVPFIVYAIKTDNWKSAIILFISAALTDIIDGALARFLNKTSVTGAYLDPIADKILVLSTYYGFLSSSSCLLIPSWFVYMVLGKELMQVGGFFLLLYIKQGSVSVCPTLLGKATTAVQFLFIIWLFFSAYTWLSTYVLLFYLFFGVVVLLLAVSFMHYIKIGYNMFIS